MKLRNVMLEISSKPFRDPSEETMRHVCRTMFEQWKALSDTADVVSVLLWVSDGSEILEYSGRPDQTFEWACWQGCANAQKPAERKAGEEETEMQKRSFFTHPRRYIPDPEPRTYAWLKRLIEVIREEGNAVAGKPVRIGATFDIGPEFAVSEFKYRTHREILRKGMTVRCNSTLHADGKAYAAFPGGIPEGTAFGHFLGKQFFCFSRDLGYDFLWLSNGIGFGSEPWSICGPLFEDHVFHPERAEKEKQTMLDFWEALYGANPGIVIETRGSNYSSGIEFATEGAPLLELYRKYKIAPPVNSPWAALNFNTGMELAAWMSHVAELPDDRFPFRFYVHDPWFCNSPWLDRYGREAWDLYLPLSVGRIDENGKTAAANSVAIITVDDSDGKMPRKVPLEVIPRIFESFESLPDMPGPLVWVYPFEEYAAFSTGREKRLEDVYTEDFFLAETIQHSLALNTVVSTANFRKLVRENGKIFEGRVLVLPVLALETNRAAVCAAMEHAPNVLVYGSLRRASRETLELLGLKRSAELSGTVEVETLLEEDLFEQDAPARHAEAYPPFDGGGLTEVPDGSEDVEVCAWAVKDGERRVLASVRTLEGGGRIAFLRSVMPSKKTVDPADPWFEYAGQEECFPVAVLARWLAGQRLGGWKIRFSAFSGSSKLHCSPYLVNSVMPRVSISCSGNAVWYSVYARNTEASIRTNSPLGAPVLTEMETGILNGDALWHPGRAWRRECRCFIRQAQDSVISSKIQTCYYPDCAGRYNYAGLRDAEVRFFPPSGCGRVEVQWGASPIPELSETLLEPEWEDTFLGRCIVLRHISGYLSFAWMK